MKNFIVRACTGLAYAVLLVGCVVYSPVSAYVFFGLVTVACLMEFGAVVNNHAEASLPRPINALGGFLLVSAVWLMATGGNGAGKMAAAWGALMLYILVRELYVRADNSLRNWALCFASQCYIAIPFSLIPLLSIYYSPSSDTLSYQWIYPLALFIFLWCNDTGAYLFGCTLSRYLSWKLFPRISPKKSWVGSIGGGLLTLAASAVIWHFYPQMPLWRWMGFALVVVVFGTWGDLVESLLKRQLGIKDSGRMLPGHGGFLDRFDSALLSIPAVVIYMILSA